MKAQANLEKSINNSPLFSIDRAANGELFVIEERRLLADLAELMSIIRHDFNETGYEIICTAKACIKAYKTDAGVFLNYFNSALKKNLKKEKAKEEISNKRSGIKVDQKTDLAIRHIIKYARSCGEDFRNSGFADKAAEALNIPLAQVHEAIAVNNNTAVASGNKTIINKEGKDDELFDFITGKLNTPEEAAVSMDGVRDIILSIDIVYKEQQVRIKPLLAKLLTMRLLRTLNDIQLIDEISSKVTFLDSEIYTNYLKTHSLPAAREIAEAHGVLETSASRTLGTFLQKISVNR